MEASIYKNKINSVKLNKMNKINKNNERAFFSVN